jgi:flagellar biogenesis protein FliO
MDLLPQLAAAAAVILLLAAALSLLKKKGWAFSVSPLKRRSNPKHLVVIERVALGPQHTLSLVQVDGNTVLVGTGPGVCEIRNVVASS